MKLNKLKMATPLTSTKTKTEPLSLELFNCAAADLDKKGEIEFECYKKYLFNHGLMDATFEFLVNGLNMEFAIHLIADGHSIPDGLFVDILTKKCQLLHKHIKSSRNYLMLVANISAKMATIKLFNKNLMDSQLLHCTISNLWDLEDQLYCLWIEVCSILKSYTVDDHSAELRNIDTYYSSLEYEEMMQACLL